MTFIPKVKTIVGGKIDGILIDPKSDRRYLGEYIQDYKGNFYKGTSITKDSETLIFQPNERKDLLKVKGLKFIYRKPSSKDYIKGVFKRYFVRDDTTSKVVEVDRPKYVEFRKLKKVYYKTYEIDWVIIGPKEDYYINNIKTPGAHTLNSELTKEAEKVVPGIKAQVLKNPLEFVI